MRQTKGTNTAQDAAPIGTSDCYTVELMCCDDLMLQEIADPKCTRKIVAKTYALALRSSYPTDFAKVNKAIIENKESDSIPEQGAPIVTEKS